MTNTYHYTEDSYEQTILDLFKEMGYEVLHWPDVDAETGREMNSRFCLFGDVGFRIPALRRKHSGGGGGGR